jgi:hypothetical protein
MRRSCSAIDLVSLTLSQHIRTRRNLAKLDPAMQLHEGKGRVRDARHASAGWSAVSEGYEMYTGPLPKKNVYSTATNSRVCFVVSSHFFKLDSLFYDSFLVLRSESRSGLKSMRRLQTHEFIIGLQTIFFDIENYYVFIG